MRLRSVLKGLSLLLWKKGASPEHVTFFATSRCNLRCRHCFHWRSLDDGKEDLSLAEIEAFSKNMEPFHLLLLTGGEPLLRPDLPEIIAIFRRNNRIQKLAIVSNGCWDAGVEARVERILREHASLDTAISISIDGLGEVHDRIRGLPGAFDRATFAWRRLKELQAGHERLTLSTITTYSRFNQDSILELFDYLKEGLKPDAMSFPLVRGDPREPECKEIDLEGYGRLLKRLCDHQLGENAARADKHFGSALITAAKSIAGGLDLKTLQELRYQGPCFAGITNAVIHANGDVYPCELLGEKMGSLRGQGYDFKKIWSSPRAGSIRGKIRAARCFCHHGCNTIANVLFNPRYLPGILARSARSAAARLTASL